jgi:hypothetical protein
MGQDQGSKSRSQRSSIKGRFWNYRPCQLSVAYVNTSLPSDRQNPMISVTNRLYCSYGPVHLARGNSEFFMKTQVLQSPMQGLYLPNGDKRMHTWRKPSSGMLRCVAVVRTDVSEESIAIIISVTRIGELGTFAVTSNRNTLRSC